MLSKANIVTDTIDQAFFTETFAYCAVKGKYIVYSKVNIKNHEEQVVFFDTKTKKTTTCINRNIFGTADLAWSYVIGETPYIRLKQKEETRFYNLIKNKTDICFPSDQTVEMVVNDIFIVSGRRKSFMRGRRSVISVYRYPDLVLIHREKGKYMGCVATDRSSVYILKN